MPMTKEFPWLLRTLGVSLALAVPFATGGCLFERGITADRLAHPAFMYERQAPEGPFVITTYERVHEAGGTANIYIEGDGKAWVGRHEPSLDPTPTNPVALHLATRDDARNVVYLARPCQYAGLANGKACPVTYWTTDQFAPELIAAESAALDDLKARYNLRGFNLIGYSGGGAMALFLAAQRHDVLSIRTVAGNLDPVLFTKIHQTTPPAADSQNPLNVAAETAHIPQHHFIGDADDIVTPALYDHFRSAVGPSTCVRSGIVAKADHDAGWVESWPELLKAPLDCNAAP